MPSFPIVSEPPVRIMCTPASVYTNRNDSFVWGCFAEPSQPRETETSYRFSSPFGTKKKMPVYVEASILTLDKIYINGGRRGYLVSVAPAVLEALVDAKPVECALPD